MGNVQGRAAATQIGIERYQRMMQPPAAGCARLPRRFLVRRMHVNRNHVFMGIERGGQGRIVGQAQIAAEPDQGCRHG